jgi:hypothetical protein
MLDPRQYSTNSPFDYFQPFQAYTYYISSFDPRLHDVTYCYYNRFQTESHIDRPM